MLDVAVKMGLIPFEGGIREVLAAASRREKEGKKVYHLEIGRPDYDSPSEAKEEVINAVREGFVHYTPLQGIPELQEVIAQKEAYHGIKVDPQKQVIVTCGAVEALMVSFVALLNPGDEVIIPTPCFSAYSDQVILANGKPVMIPSRLGDAYNIDLESIEKAITPRTKMIIFNSPNNPSGAIIDRESLYGLAELADKHDLYVISDDCYEDFVFEGRHESIACLPGMEQRTILVNSLSKSYSMTGWRIGYIISHPEIFRYLLKVHQLLSTSACSFAQRGAVDAIRSGGLLNRAMVKDFKERRDLVMSYLDQCPGLVCNRPRGAFYVFPSIKGLGISGLDFCNEILEKEGVALVPGDVFGGEGHIRIAYTCPREDLEIAMGKFVSTYRRLLSKV